MNFKFDPRIMEHVGSDLITSDEVAITELIKNSYDAKSEEVRLHFLSNIDMAKKLAQNEKMLVPVNDEIFLIIPDSFSHEELIVIEDIGNGMNYTQLQEGFFTVGTDIKKNSKAVMKDDGKSERIPLGEKGIGRLSAQRLGRVMLVETTSKDSDITYIMLVNWEDFYRANKKIEEINIPEYKIPKVRESYTRLWILGSNVYRNVLLNDNYIGQTSLINNMGISEKLKSSVSFLMSPFEETKEEFTVLVYRNGDKIKTKFDNEMLQIAHSEHSFELMNTNQGLKLKSNMKIQPWYLERVHLSLTPNDYFNKYKKEHIFYSDLINKFSKRFDASLSDYMNEFQIKEYLTEELKKEFLKDIKGENKKLQDEFNKAIENVVDERIKQLKEICPILCRVYSFRRDHHASSIDISSSKAHKKFKNEESYQSVNINSLRDFLNVNNGVKLYRGNCRIGSLGDKDNDWIQLQQYRTTGQQFYRFDLGNTVGYVRINDPLQQFVREISSRLDLKENGHSVALKEFVKNMFNDLFYKFSSRANHICKDIIEEEGLIPKETTKDIDQNIKEAQDIIAESKGYFDLLEKSFAIVDKNISLNSDDEKDSVRKAFESLKETRYALSKNFNRTMNNVEKSGELLSRVKKREDLIKKEAYNNYKLMANGLVTEAITHELHSLITDKQNTEGIELNFAEIKRYLIKTKNIGLYNTHYRPVYSRFTNLNERMKELGNFYSFIEKTFVKKGSIEEFIQEDIKAFLKILEERLLKRLKDNKIRLEYSTIDMNWVVPKGVLLHVFYNLIDNSIYWIDERRRKAVYDKHFERIDGDIIKIEKKDDNTILFSDSGTGVLEQYQYILFQPLESGKPNGRGMGLYIVRNLLRSFHADIELTEDKNAYGNRYTFAIYKND